MYYNIIENVENSLRFDMNNLIEDGFIFFQQSTPRMQTEVIELLFGDILG